MDHIFWLEPGRVAGRPGPDTHPWDPTAFNNAGFTGIVSVNDGLSCDPNQIRNAGLDYLCQPLTSNAPPVKGDLERCLQALPLAYRFVDSQLATGGKVLIHCTSGKDRTGMLMAYTLMQRQGLDPGEAMAAVWRVREIAFSAEGWEQFTYDVLCASDSSTNQQI
jgi:protein-tyrosine phosphatase